jgi:hypothetical protein
MSKPEEMWQCQFSNRGYTYDPARGDIKARFLRGPVWRTSLTIGSARAAGHPRRCSGLWQDLVRWPNKRATVPIDHRPQQTSRVVHP